MTRYSEALSELFAQPAFPEDAFYIDKTFHGRKTIVYGAGESFHYFKEIVMRQYGYTPSLVLDRKFCPGDSFEGISACSPHDYAPSIEEQHDAVVVVCLGNQSYMDEVLQTLRLMGFRRVISIRDVYEVHNPFRLPLALEAKGFQYYLEQRRHIESCFLLLADDHSRDVYLSCLQTHLRRKPVPIPMCERHEQYTPHGIELARGYARFIYCGVSVGEMAGIFNRIGKVEELVCFEPDPNQYSLTAEFLQCHHGTIGQRVTVIPCGVHSREAIAPFTYSDTSFGSRFLEEGEATIQSVTIDHVLPDFRPTIITMDIEGAELEALKGAEHTIRSHRPDLAICLYHAPNHLWEIPHYLHSLNLGYRFYIRNYTSLVSETVLYATACAAS